VRLINAKLSSDFFPIDFCFLRHAVWMFSSAPRLQSGVVVGDILYGGQLATFIVRVPLFTWLSFVRKLLLTPENRVFKQSYGFPGPRRYFRSKTIGAYTESFSTGPELMQSPYRPHKKAGNDLFIPNLKLRETFPPQGTYLL